MTDPNPPITPIDDVTVTGQRARGPSPFADLQFPTKGVGNPTGPDQNELDPNGPPAGDGPSDESQQCATEGGAREWNKDALAIAAIAVMKAEALARHQETNFNNREYGALICEFSDGTIALGPTFEGPMVGAPVGGRGGVDIDPMSCGSSATPLGFIHTHPSSTYASASDIAYLHRLVTEAGANPATVSAYVIANQAAELYGPGVDRVSVAKISDEEEVHQPGYQPAWVNPDAKSCP